MKAKMMLFARDFMIDQAVNRVSAYSLFEGGIAANAFPFVIAPFSILLVSLKESGDKDGAPVNFKIALNKEELLSTTVKINFQGMPWSRHLMRFDGMPILKPGTLTVTVTSKTGKKLISTSLEIGQQDSAKVRKSKPTPSNNSVKTSSKFFKNA